MVHLLSLVPENPMDSFESPKSQHEAVIELTYCNKSLGKKQCTNQNTTAFLLYLYTL